MPTEHDILSQRNNHAFWCAEYGEVCGCANDMGYCKLTACIIHTQKTIAVEAPKGADK